VRSTDGETGCVPAAVAELLGVPLLSTLAKVEVQAQQLPSQGDGAGYVAYECPAPAVLSVIKGINEPRYPSMKGIMGAKKKPLDVKDASALNLDCPNWDCPEPRPACYRPALPNPARRE